MHITLLLLLLNIPLLLCAQEAITNNQHNRDEHQKQLDPQNLAKLEVLGNLGDISSQYRLGHSYLTGKGTTKNAKKAVFWFNKAARNGHVISQRTLATLFYSGIGMRKAPAHAVKWFRKAAENGDAVAQSALADMYYRGIGMHRPDLKQAWQWMMASAKNGDAIAQYRVGLMLRDGRGTRPNLSRAFLWLHVATLNTPDYEQRQQITTERDKVGERMNKRQLSATKLQSEAFAQKYVKNVPLTQE